MKLAPIALAAVAAVTLTACGSSGEAAPAASSTTAPAAIQTPTPAATPVAATASGEAVSEGMYATGDRDTHTSFAFVPSEAVDAMGKRIAAAHKACGAPVYVYRVMIDNSEGVAENGVMQTQVVSGGATFDALNNENNDTDGGLYGKCSKAKASDAALAEAVKIDNALSQKVLPGAKGISYQVYSVAIMEPARFFMRSWAGVGEPLEFTRA